MIPFQKPHWTCCYSKLSGLVNGREMSSQIWEGIWVLSPSRSWARAVVGRQETDSWRLPPSAIPGRLFLEQEWKLAPGDMPALSCLPGRGGHKPNCSALGRCQTEDPPLCNYYAKNCISFCLCHLHMMTHMLACIGCLQPSCVTFINFVKGYLVERILFCFVIIV